MFPMFDFCFQEPIFKGPSFPKCSSALCKPVARGLSCCTYSPRVSLKPRTDHRKKLIAESWDVAVFETFMEEKRQRDLHLSEAFAIGQPASNESIGVGWIARVQFARKIAHTWKQLRIAL